ncbi:MAG: metallophosphoesterase [Candidatus Levyibacteriota bacterium]
MVNLDIKKKILLSIVLLAVLIVIFNLRIVGKNGVKKDADPQKVLKSIQNGYTVLAAGDIGDCWSKNTAATETAKLLGKFPGIPILTLGDNSNIDGTKEDYETCFDPTWGRYKDRIFPSVGNHDYHAKGAVPYYEYFGEKAGEPGKGYYSFNLGNWHLIAVNTDIIADPCSATSDICKGFLEEMDWLKKDLEQNKTDCTLIFGHYPRFSSGITSATIGVDPLWKLAYSENVDLILNGHAHDYERFAPQDPQGNLDLKRGIREIVVGTGGADLTGYGDIAKNTEIITNRVHGILKLILGKGEYGWEFISVDGSFVDKGQSSCH